MPSVLFDAAVVPDGAGAADRLSALGHAREFLKDQYRHCKPILMLGAGERVAAGCRRADRKRLGLGHGARPLGLRRRHRQAPQLGPRDRSARRVTEVASGTGLVRPGATDGVPERSPVALLMLDVINDLEFPGGERLFRHALPMARRLARLRARAARAGIPAIYVNDNYGRWQSDFRRLTAHCRRAGGRGKPIVDLLAPTAEDYFVLKPKHSGFFSTALGVLLGYLGARTLIITGIAGNICVLFTANDAYMRDFRLVVPADCIASETASDNRRALATMRTLLKADVTPSTRLSLGRLVARHRSRSGRA